MRILIYGAGAVGCYIGGHLALAGHDITLLGRSRLAEAITTSGLTLQSGGIKQSISSISVKTNLQDAFSSEVAYDIIAFTMKAYDAAPAAADLQPFLLTLPPIISFQNGVGSEDSLRMLFGPERIVSGTLLTAVSMPEPGTIIEEKQRGIALADDVPAAKSALEALSQTALNISALPDSRSLKWSKLLLNMLGNATSAILDMPLSAIYADPRLFAIERAAFIEALHILELQDIKLYDLPGTPVRLLASIMRWFPPVISRPLLKQKVARGRGEKPPSLLLALRASSRKTEAAWLNGAVAGAAKQLGRAAPINHALALTVSDIAAGRVPWDMYRQNPDMLLTTIRAAQGPQEKR